MEISKLDQIIKLNNKRKDCLDKIENIKCLLDIYSISKDIDFNLYIPPITKDHVVTPYKYVLFKEDVVPIFKMSDFNEFIIQGQTNSIGGKFNEDDTDLGLSMNEKTNDVIHLENIDHNLLLIILNSCFKYYKGKLAHLEKEIEIL